MLSYEEFSESMLEVQAWFDKLDQINACGLWLWDWSHGGCGHLVIELLIKLMHDEDRWIEYFVYELDWGKRTDLHASWEDGTPIPLNTLDDLYRLLEACYQE